MMSFNRFRVFKQNKMKIFQLFICALLLCLLPGCRTVINSVQEGLDAAEIPIAEVVENEIEKIDGKSGFETVADESTYHFKKAFTGTVYILVYRDDLENKDLKATKFMANDYTFSNVEKKSSDDFNVRYNDKTYFSIQKLSVSNLDSLKLKSTWNKPVLLVFDPNH